MCPEKTRVICASHARPNQGMPCIRLSGYHFASDSVYTANALRISFIAAQDL